MDRGEPSWANTKKGLTSVPWENIPLEGYTGKKMSMIPVE
jgi:hypothetical protein